MQNLQAWLDTDGDTAINHLASQKQLSVATNNRLTYYHSRHDHDRDESMPTINGSRILQRRNQPRNLNSHNQINRSHRCWVLCAVPGQLLAKPGETTYNNDCPLNADVKRHSRSFLAESITRHSTEATNRTGCRFRWGDRYSIFCWFWDQFCWLVRVHLDKWNRAERRRPWTGVWRNSTSFWLFDRHFSCVRRLPLGKQLADIRVNNGRNLYVPASLIVRFCQIR